MTEKEEIWLDKVKPDLNQPRREFDEDELKALAEGIKRQGVINAIEIDENNIIIDGERRWRACKMAGLTRIKFTRTTLKEKLKKDPQFLLKRQLQANLTGRHLKIVEARKAIEKLLSNVGQSKSGHKEESLRKLANELGIGKSMLSLILKLDREGTDNLKKAVERGDIPFSTATELSYIPDKDVQNAMLEHVMEEDLNRDEAKHLVQEIKDMPTDKAIDLIEANESILPMARETAQAISNAYKKIPEMEHDKGYANYLFMRGVEGALNQNKLFCPKCKKTVLKWSCCGEALDKTITNLSKKYNGGN